MAVSENSGSPKKKIKVTKKVKKKKLRPEASSSSKEEETIIVGRMEEEPFKSKEEDVVITLEGPDDEDLDLDEEFEDDSDLDEDYEYEETDIQPEEVGEEVVVISLGRPPEEPPHEEVITTKPPRVPLEEPVEAVIVEEEPEKSPPVKEEKGEGRKIGAAFIVLIIIIAAVAGSIGVYFLLGQNQDPEARLTLSPPTAMAGEAVMFDASNSTDDKDVVEYRWDFGDDSVPYSEDDHSAPDGNFDGKTTYFYEEEGTFTVELKVTDEEGRVGSVSSLITISELTVTIPYEKVGDKITYDVDGYFDIEDSEGFYSEEIDRLGEVTVNRIYMEFEGYMETDNRNTPTAQDGYGMEHDTLERYNEEDLELSGTLYVSIENAGSTPFPIQDGDLTIRDSAYIDLTTNKTIHSYTESNLVVSAGNEMGIESTDYLWSYPNLREKPAAFRVEDLKPDRTFKMGDSDLQNLGDIAYHWEVVNITNIKGLPALGIEVMVDVEDATIEPYTVRQLNMHVYIANGIPFPIGTYIYGILEDDSTTITALYNNEIQEKGWFERGTLGIPFGSCNGDGTEEHYPRVNPDYSLISWDEDDYLPDIGGGSVSFDFNPQVAIEHAKGSGTFNNYLASNPDAYVTNGYYNETGDNPLWNLTFGEKDDIDGYYVVVENDSGSMSIIDQDPVTLPELVNTTEDFDPVLSFSDSELVFKDDQIVNQDAIDGLGDVAFYDGFRYGVRANVVYPSLSLTINLAMERTGYAYFLEKEDGTLLSGVDAMNGQIMYVWRHEGDSIPLP